MNKQWDDNEFPLAYLITFRTYGTWLHGDERGSVDTHGKNIYGTPKIDPNKNLEKRMRTNAGQEPILLNEKQRRLIEESIEETCKIKNFDLFAVNVRTNHVHAVVSAQTPPEPIINSLKSFATRKLRENYLALKDEKIWSRGGSRRYLWKKHHVDEAIDYVLYGQGKLPFELK